MSDPELSVVVGLISGEVDDLERCLTALEKQEDPPEHEVIVPYDPPCRAVTTLAGKFPRVTFLEAAHLDTAAARKGLSREHHDTLRTIGLQAARANVVALTEDHAVASPSWCRDMVDLLAEFERVAAIGGAVECGKDRLLNRAVYYCDFGRYQNPLPEGPAPFLSDANVAYRREALESVREVWRDDYHEPLVHGALAEKGHELWLTPRSLVHQRREHLKWSGAFRERFVWGRSYAGSRWDHKPLPGRLVYAALTVLLPFVLTLRLFRGVMQRKRGLGGFLLALPIIFVLQCFWALGEFWGYVTGSPGRI